MQCRIFPVTAGVKRGRLRCLGQHAPGSSSFPSFFSFSSTFSDFPQLLQFFLNFLIFSSTKCIFFKVYFPDFFLPKCIYLKRIFAKCNYPKCNLEKCTPLACILSFACLCEICKAFWNFFYPFWDSKKGRKRPFPFSLFLSGAQSFSRENGLNVLHVMRDHPQHSVPMLAGLWGAQLMGSRKVW